jgi:hypothetical protein
MKGGLLLPNIGMEKDLSPGLRNLINVQVGARKSNLVNRRLDFRICKLLEIVYLKIANSDAPEYRSDIACKQIDSSLLTWPFHQLGSSAS